MTSIKYLYLFSLAISSCNNSPNKSINWQDKLISRDSNSVSIEKPKISVPIQETHLRDTIFIGGHFVLFLRPDSLRFESYAKDPDGGIYEADSDFGFAISATMDSMSRLKRYKDIKSNVSTERYIVIRDCKNCPRTIDRDEIDYGLILSSPGKDIKIDSFLHSGDYLYLVDKYFNLKNGYSSQTSLLPK